jgi:hypothetical protein
MSLASLSAQSLWVVREETQRILRQMIDRSSRILES